MSTAVLTPVDRGRTVDLGRATFRKQILKPGTINYRGRRLDFTRDYLAGLVQAFKDGAYGQVPFVLADPATNGHTMDPERYRGQVTDLQLGDDGLYATVELTEDGAKVVRDNPNLGVSARIVEDLTHADGRAYPRAIQHVLGTFDPRVTGMGPWQRVDLSADETDEVVDLTAAEINEEEAAVDDTDPNAQQPQGVDEEERGLFQRFRDWLRQDEQTTQGATSGGDTADRGASDDDLDAIAAAVAQDAAQEQGAEQAEAHPEPVGAGAALANEVQAALDLARSTAEQSRAEAARLRAERDHERAGHEAERYLRDGVPPALVDLARPLLATSGTTVDLARPDGTSEQVDAAGIVRQMLDAAKGMVDLSDEIGTPTAPEVDNELAALTEQWTREFGTK